MDASKNNATKGICIKDYNYDLPDGRIAKFPMRERDHSKLLVYNKGNITEDVFYNIPDHLPQGALMVFNNTKVIQARLHFHKETGAQIEVFLLEPAAPADYEQMFQSRGHCSWLCLVGNLKKWKDGALSVVFDVCGRSVTLSATRAGEVHGSFMIDFNWDDTEITFSEIIDAAGELPIPPYLNRKTEDSDKLTYQTVYSKMKGSVAAPTAGLHFTPDVLRALDKHGIDREELTLHVGAGTFKPVKSSVLSGHEMHNEHISVHRSTLEKLIAHNCSAIAVGTTSVRTLESLYYIGVMLAENPDIDMDSIHVDQWMPYDTAPSLTPAEAIRSIIAYLDKNKVSTLHAGTQIIIAPGYEYKIVKMLITNFHQPQSTLLLLVSAFVKGRWREIYDYALAHDFRFLSYGDSSLIIP